MDYSRMVKKGENLQDPPPDPDRDPGRNPVRVGFYYFFKRVVKSASPAIYVDSFILMCSAGNGPMCNGLRNHCGEKVCAGRITVLEMLQPLPFIIKQGLILVAAQNLQRDEFGGPPCAHPQINI